MRNIKSIYNFARNTNVFPFIADLFIIISIVTPIISTTFLIFADYIDILILSSYVFAPLLITPVFYTIYRNTEDYSTTISHKYIDIAYLLLFSYSVLLLLTNDIRPLIYFIVIALIWCIVSIEIITASPIHRTKVLIKLSLVTLNILWGVTLKYYYFFAGSDIFSHVASITSVSTQGLSFSSMGLYAWFPLWHILNNILYNMIGGSIEARHIMFILSGLIYVGILISVYSLSVNLLDNIRISLLAALFASMNMFFIYYGMYSIPRSVIPLLVILSILISRFSSPIKKLPLVLFCPAIVIYHTASVPFVVISVLAIYILNKLFGLSSTFRIGNLISLLFLVNIGYWMYNADRIFVTAVSRIYSSLAASQEINRSSGPVVGDPMAELANIVHFSGTLLFIFYSLIAGMKSKEISSESKVYILSGVLLVGISFPGPIYLLGDIATGLNMDRVGMYTIPFISIPAAVGYYSMFKSGNHNIKFVILLLLAVTGLFTVGNDFVAKDNPIVDRQGSERFYMTNQEVNSLDKIATISQKKIITDHLSIRYLNSKEYKARTSIIQIDSKKKIIKGYDGILLIREDPYFSNNLKTLHINSDKYRDPPENWKYMARSSNYGSTTTISIQTESRIYDSGNVSWYH